MVQINTKLDGLKKQLEELRKQAPGVAFAIATEIAGECERVGKTTSIIPKKTGNLRSTARVEVIRNKSVKFVVGGMYGNPSKRGVSSVLVDYALYVNNGTSRQSPQFFMERIASRVYRNDKAFYNEVISSWFRRIEAIK